MKKVLLSLILALATTFTMAASEVQDVSVDTVTAAEKALVAEPVVNVAQLLGISENTLSDDLKNIMAWQGIPNRPHFIFPNLQQCQAIPECVCEPYNGQWGCFIR
ncbi:hypothetical protein ACFODZ_13810 [Marinicella sediminis]|uniref:Uncharacterized protein n=1 Tax=Marinicella sediminis TaxID=1792834 RepID=A0ABV7JBF9_9GAMM|nr:hypothetical protein [Marinicella sediminis]